MKSLIDVALGEYGVKEIIGGKHNPRILEYHSTTGGFSDDETAWCLDKNIEILTDKGFIKFKDVELENPSKIAMVNDDQEVLMTSDFLFVKKRFNGIAKKINTNNLSIICDPDHEFYGRCDGSSLFKKKKIKNITQSGIGIPPIHTSNARANIEDVELKLLAAYVSDGHKSFNRIVIGVSKQRKIHILRTLFPVYEKEDTKSYGTRKLRTKFSFKHPSIFYDCVSEKKELKWEFYSTLSKEQCELFIDTFLMFDGDGKSELFTSLKANQEALNYIATMAGRKSTAYSVKQVSKNTKVEYIYTVYVSKNKLRYILDSHVSDIDYNDELYCASVPTGKIVIRCFNGNIIQVGNCSSFVNWCAMQSGCARSGKANARSWLGVGQKVETPEVGDVVILKRGTSEWQGHVALFIREDGNFLWLLGGNQGDMVKIAAYAKSDLLGYRRV